MIGERVWTVPVEQFVAAWNAASTLDEAARAIREKADGPTPRWAVVARAGVLRKDGVSLKSLPLVTDPPN